VADLQVNVHLFVGEDRIMCLIITVIINIPNDIMQSGRHADHH
jgi:hypothetical protein